MYEKKDYQIDFFVTDVKEHVSHTAKNNVLVMYTLPI